MMSYKTHPLSIEPTFLADDTSSLSRSNNKNIVGQTLEKIKLLVQCILHRTVNYFH